MPEEDVPLPLGDDGEPKRDFTKMLDLNRTTLTRDMVDRYLDAMQRQQIAAEDIKIITASAKEQEYKPNDIAAMKLVAKLKLNGKQTEAREKLEALERVSEAVGFDLFGFPSVRK
jgi:hypothetical protein